MDTPDSYESLKARLGELNYMHPFPPDAAPLVDQLTSDLIAIVTSYKELEAEAEAKAEELQEAVGEIHRLGVLENPRLVRENHELHLRVMEVAESAASETRKVQLDLADKSERVLKFELLVSQLNFALASSEQENAQLRDRVSQLLLQDSAPDAETIYNSTRFQLPALETVVPRVPHAPGVDHSAAVAHLQQANAGLERQLSQLEFEQKSTLSKYESLQTKFLAQSPITLSGNLTGLLSGREAVAEIESKLDFVNEQYRELKILHARCGLVSDCPLVDLRESRKEANFLSQRVEKLRAENEKLRSEKRTVGAPPTSVGVGCSEEGGSLRLELESARRELRVVTNELKLKEKEVKQLRTVSGPAVKSGDARRLVGEIAILEERLRQVTEDRDELVQRLGEIEAGVAQLEAETRRVETLNQDLLREKAAKEESFVGISNQLNEVNLLLNALSEESPPMEIERLRFRQGQLENELREKVARIAKLEAEVVKSRNPVETVKEKVIIQKPHTLLPSVSRLEMELADLQSLVKSLTTAKDQTVHQLRNTETELADVRAELTRVEASKTAASKFEQECVELKRALVKLDADRDELQRICDDQAEQTEALRESNRKHREEIAELSRALNQVRAETNQLHQHLEERQRELQRVETRAAENSQRVEKYSKDCEELTRDNQLLVTELQRAQQAGQFAERTRGELESLMADLRATEAERNDILGLYKQVVAENKALHREEANTAERDAAEISRIAIELERVQTQLRETQTQNLALHAQMDGGDQMARLEQVLQIERERNRQLQLRLPADDDVLRRTIEQQYALIGEMDAEQARLLLENSQLREQLH